MKSLRLRSTIMASIASMLICTMLLGSVLISNVYAKGSGSEKSKYNLDENCKDSHKGQQITTTGDRNVETIDTSLDQKSNNKLKTTTDEDAIVDEDATAGGNITGTLGFVNPFLQFSVDTNGIPDPGLNVNLLNQIGTQIDDNHFEIGDNFVTLNPDGSVSIIPLKDVTNQKIKSKLNQDEDQRIKDTLKYKKTFPLKERREFNVCGLPIGNIVDGFQYNEIDGTKKSDILLGTSAADDIKGKDGGDVIQARDDDDIVHGGRVTTPFKEALATITFMLTMEMTPYSLGQMMIMKMEAMGMMNYTHKMETML